MSSRRRKRRPVPRKAPAKPAQSPARPAAAKPASAKPARPATPKKGALSHEHQRETRDPLIGQRVGRCTILERIGMGRTAIVYKAHYEALDDVVAVKILTKEASALDELVERFVTEARVIAQLDNENIVKIYDVGSDGDRHFIVMELLDGEEAIEIISRDEEVDPMDALRVIRQGANGLAAAHAKGIVHRDVKPQNLLLLADGTVKVLDFGLAARFEESSKRVGTPHYMAPEVCESGKAELGSDIYALGILLYHLLVGEPPYAGESIRNILKLHIKGAPLYPEHKRPGLPKEICELVRSLTKTDPLTRPSAADLVEMLDNIGGEELQQKDTLKRRRKRAKRVATARARRSAAPLIVGAVVVAGAVTAVLLTMSTGNDEPSEPTEGSTPTPVAVVDPEPEVVPPVVDKPNPPLPKVETEGERIVRERMEREEEKKKEQRKKEREGREAFERAQDWVRKHWHGKADTPAVIDKYNSVRARFKGTDIATKIRDLVRDIKANKVHPHPDRSYSDEASVADTRREWAAARPLIERKIAQHAYTEAAGMVPDVVNDADGELATALRFWHEFMRDLKEFQLGLAKAVQKLEGDDRKIVTPKGEGEVRLMDTVKFTVRVDGANQEFSWAELDAKQIYKLARRAYKGKGTRYFVHEMAFAFAHKLEDEFWNLVLDIESASDGDRFKDRVTKYQDRYDNR